MFSLKDADGNELAVVPSLAENIGERQARFVLSVWLADQREYERKATATDPRPKEVQAELTAIMEAACDAVTALSNASERTLWELAYGIENRREADLRNAPLVRALGGAPSNGGLAIKLLGQGLLLVVQAAEQMKAAGTQPRKGRPKDLRRAFAVTELAEIFEILTGQKATRRTRGKDHAERGQEYGPFWDFVNAVWKALAGNTRGLMSRYRLWDKFNQRGQAESNWIVSLEQRYPEWRSCPR